jgi:hypothetical protein
MTPHSFAVEKMVFHHRLIVKAQPATLRFGIAA